MTTTLPLMLALTGLAGMALALVSGPLERRVPISEPMVALVLGVLVGPTVLGLVSVDTTTRDLIMLEGSRILLAGSVMAAALRYPATSLLGLLRPTLLLLAVVMPLTALTTGLLSLATGIPIALALLVGACLAPTDPVLAAAVVSGEPAQRVLPHRVRSLLSLESGANDGLGIVLVGAAVALTLPAASLGTETVDVLRQVLVGSGIGALLGLVAGRALTWARTRHEVGSGPELVYSLLLAAAVLGTARLLEAAGVLGVFVAGLVYNRTVGEEPRETQEAVDDAINTFAVLPLFGLLGLTLPWGEWGALGPGAVLFVVGLVLLRRLPWVLAAGRGLGLARRQAVYTGFFGPMGISALFYLAHARDEGVGDPRLYALVTLAVAVSTLVFGISGVPARRAYARRFGEEGDEG